MDMYGWLQLAAFVGLLLLLTKPMGLYLFRVLDGEGRTFLDPVLKPVELLFYRIFRVDRKQEQTGSNIPFLCSCSVLSACFSRMSFYGFNTCCL